MASQSHRTLDTRDGGQPSTSDLARRPVASPLVTCSVTPCGWRTGISVGGEPEYHASPTRGDVVGCDGEQACLRPEGGGGGFDAGFGLSTLSRIREAGDWGLLVRVMVVGDLVRKRSVDEDGPSRVALARATFPPEKISGFSSSRRLKSAARVMVAALSCAGITPCGW